MADQEQLERRIAHLERRLDEYLASQRQALEHQAEFQLKATWGIVRSTSGIFFLFAPGLAAHWIAKWAGVDNWLTWAVGVVVGFVAWYLYAGHVERGYEDDVKKLGELPNPPRFYRG